MEGTWTLVGQNGKQEQLAPYRMRIYSQEEYAEMTLRNGFRQVKFYGSFEGEPFSKDSREMIMIAKK